MNDFFYSDIDFFPKKAYNRNMKKFNSLNAVLNNMNVYVRRAIYDVVPLGWEIFERIIFDYEIMYVAEGNCMVRLGENVYHAQKGDLFFIKPNVRHSMKAEGNARLHQPHVHFDFHYDDNSGKVYIPIMKGQDTDKDLSLLRQDVTTKELLYIREYFQFKDDPYARSLLMHIIELQNSLRPADIIRKNAYLLEIICFLAKASSREDDAVDYEKDSFELVNKIIESNYNKPLRLSQVCAQIGYSKNYFTHIYKAKFGCTPKQYHEEIRIDKAISYLSIKSITVTEIAYTLGFETIHDFSRFFKRKTGLSPSEYRENNR